VHFHFGSEAACCEVIAIGGLLLLADHVVLTFASQARSAGSQAEREFKRA